MRPLAILAVLVLAGTALVAGALALWLRSASAASGAPADLAERRALDAVVLVLGPGSVLAAAAAGALSPPRSFAIPLALALAAALGGAAALAVLRVLWAIPGAAPPDPALAALLYGSFALASSGAFLAFRSLLGGELAFVAVAGLLALATGNVFFANGFVESAEGEARGDRIALVLSTNPLAATAGALTDVDLLRTEALYRRSVIGPYYPYRYPTLAETCRRALAAAAAGLAGAALVGLLGRRWRGKGVGG